MTPRAPCRKLVVMTRTVRAGADESIAGVSLETYATIIRELGARGDGPAGLAGIASTHGIAGADWSAASTGWGARLKADSLLSERFNSLYTSA